MKNELIQAKNVSRNYILKGEKIEALRNINLYIFLTDFIYITKGVSTEGLTKTHVEYVYRLISLTPEVKSLTRFHQIVVLKGNG